VLSSPLAIQQAHCCRLPLDRVVVVSLRARHLPRQSRRGSVMIDGNGGRERTPLLEARRGGISTSSSPTRLQSQRSKSQGYMRLLLMTHVPRCPHVDACVRVLALVFAWQKESPPETYHGGGCFVGGGRKIPCFNFFMGLHASASPGGQNLKIGRR
jgi:hypothetical protein